MNSHQFKGHFRLRMACRGMITFISQMKKESTLMLAEEITNKSVYLFLPFHLFGKKCLTFG